MYQKECYCGKSKKNFRMDIGPKFMNKCCKEAGYDAKGNPPKGAPKSAPKAPETKPEPKKSMMDIFSAPKEEKPKAQPQKKTKKRSSRRKKNQDN